MPLTAADEARLRAIESRLVTHDFPPQLVVENTSYCTMRCVHCAHSVMSRPQQHMPRALWDKIVEEVGREAPATELWPTFYGEALILGRHGELWDRLDHAARAGCTNIVLNSNGELLDRWDNIERVLDSPLRRFILSLDGFSKETFESIRVGGDRDAIFASVETLIRRRRERGQAYPVVICQFSVMEQNAHELPVFRRHWEALGAEVKVRTMMEWTGGAGIQSTAIDHATSFRIACPWALNTMAIHQNGDCVACAVDYDGGLVVGNASDLTVKELWRRLGPALRDIHRGHRWADLPELCRGCGDWQAAGAEYAEEEVAGTRPFWFDDLR